MRPYKFRIRLSSRRLNVTRLGNGPAAALRAAARASLGSASSDIELMERLLSCQRHDCANCAPLQEGGDKAAQIRTRRMVLAPVGRGKNPVTGSLAES